MSQSLDIKSAKNCILSSDAQMAVISAGVADDLWVG